MLKTSLNIKKLNLDLDNENIFNDLKFSTKISSLNIILNDSFRSDLFFKAVLNLIDSKISATFFSFQLFDSLEEIGYYSSDYDIYKNISIQKFFQYSNSFYKNDYTDNYIKLLSLFNFNMSDKICSLKKEKYELLKMIEVLYHNPSLLLINSIEKNINDDDLSKINDIFLNLKNELGCSIVLYTNKLNYLYNKDNNYFIFNDGKLLNINDISNKYITITYKPNKGLLISNFNFNIVRLENEDKLTYSGNFKDLLKELSKYFIEIYSIEIGDII